MNAEENKKNGPGLKDVINHPRTRHYTVYLVFGVVTTLVNLLVYKILLDKGFHYTLSTTMAFMVAVTVAFWTNRTWVFRSQRRGLKGIFREMTSFFSVRMLTYVVDVVGLVFFIELIGLDEFFSKVIISLLVVVLNYVLSRFVVFHTKAQ